MKKSTKQLVGLVAISVITVTIGLVIWYSTIGWRKVQHFTMQTFTQQDCQALSLCGLVGKCNEKKSTIKLTDERDGKVYTIRRFADGNCWMIDNLAYGGGENGSGDYCVDKNDLSSPHYWREASNEANFVATNANGLNNPANSHPTLIGDCVNPAFADNYCNTVAKDSCGYLYNFYAASQLTEADDAGAYIQGICPAGWIIPQALGDRSFDGLQVFKNYVTEEMTVGIPELQGPATSITYWSFTGAGRITDNSHAVVDMSKNSWYWLNKKQANATYGLSIRCILK